MYDKELAFEILNQIRKSSQTILKRFKQIKSCNDFTSSDWGMEKLDSICMQLIAIGEGLKNLDKVTNNSILPNYPQIEWKKVKGMRDIVSHHYFDLNAEAVYDVCSNHIEALDLIIKKIIEEI
ncbi:MAG: DUF86 domain-containing protein [Desulfamplus sp.]|nr:DUF86 domain-containing protein [Desulfamplus sp.]